MARFKKGQKVIRFSGRSSGTEKTMRIGDVGTIAKNQKYPGIVEIVEFPGSMGHDVGRLLRIDGLPDKLSKRIKKLVKELDHDETSVRLDIISSLMEGYCLGANL